MFKRRLFIFMESFYAPQGLNDRISEHCRGPCPVRSSARPKQAWARQLHLLYDFFCRNLSWLIAVSILCTLCQLNGSIN